MYRVAATLSMVFGPPPVVAALTSCAVPSLAKAGGGGVGSGAAVLSFAVLRVDQANELLSLLSELPHAASASEHPPAITAASVRREAIMNAASEASRRGTARRTAARSRAAPSSPAAPSARAAASATQCAA